MTYLQSYLLKSIASPFEGFGKLALFIWRAFLHSFAPALSFKLLIRQIEFVGNRSIGIILLTGMMIGTVFGIQFGEIFRTFGAEGLIGASAGYALSKELAPVIGSFLVTARAGSAMTAEIAIMRVNEQIDAMRVMAVNPYNYLVAPRLWASVIVMPLLTVLFTMAGLIAAYFIGVLIYDVDVAVFFDKIQWIVKPRHIFQGLEKAVIFGVLFSGVGCYKGFHASGGAKGVGRATTEAVVISLVSILVIDFFISYFQYQLEQSNMLQ